KESRLPRTDCHQTRTLHGLVTAPVPTHNTLAVHRHHELPVRDTESSHNAL
ncbi:hypothetical protein M9458_023023, partial [Cirrhinus mrigala]